ncbi:hypothetical protein [Clostridium botulinum]|uniref:hypothetical protein n=1 Tax=Clostridium botulinum TaxID=1491 RepID=UPI0019680D05|nr:hypothetical protein [Clostridium botulinum]
MQKILEVLLRIEKKLDAIQERTITVEEKNKFLIKDFRGALEEMSINAKLSKSNMR